jgi:hypothetical protein
MGEEVRAKQEEGRSTDYYGIVGKGCMHVSLRTSKLAGWAGIGRLRHPECIGQLLHC